MKLILIKKDWFGEAKSIFGIDISDLIKDKNIDVDALTEELERKALEKYSAKEVEIGEQHIRELERVVMLKVVDQKWMDHIDAMDELKDGIGLRAYGQKDPVVQYRIEGFDMFDEMIGNIKMDVVRILLNMQKQGEIKREETVKITKESLENLNNLDNQTVRKQVVNNEPKVGRNEPCPCGSSKKYKNCCGK